MEFRPPTVTQRAEILLLHALGDAILDYTPGAHDRAQFLGLLEQRLRETQVFGSPAAVHSSNRFLRALRFNLWLKTESNLRNHS